MAENRNHYCVCRSQADLPPEDLRILQRSRAALLKSAKWQPGAVITIRFLEGDPTLQQRVQTTAREWLKFANLGFDFRQSGDTDIRIVHGRISARSAGRSRRINPP